jgi:hypothetical protein
MGLDWLQLSAVVRIEPIMSDKPGHHYKEWLRKNAWPFLKREREGADSVMPHLQEYLEQSRLLRKRDEEPADRERKSERDKPRH